MMAPKKSKTRSKKGKITKVSSTEPNRVENALRESEEKFRTIFNNASDAFFFIDSEGRFIDVNRGACELTGYNYDELLQMRPHDFAGPDAAPLIPEHVREVQEKGSMLFETQINPKEGKPIPVEISARLIEYRGKKTFLAIVRDTTERKKAETARLLHEKAMASSPSGIVITDLKGKITYLNDSFMNIIGQKNKERLLELLHERCSHGGSPRPSHHRLCTGQRRAGPLQPGGDRTEGSVQGDGVLRPVSVYPNRRLTHGRSGPADTRKVYASCTTGLNFHSFGLSYPLALANSLA